MSSSLDLIVNLQINSEQCAFLSDFILNRKHNPECDSIKSEQHEQVLPSHINTVKGGKQKSKKVNVILCVLFTKGMVVDHQDLTI